jgi:hypothetical protein
MRINITLTLTLALIMIIIITREGALVSKKEGKSSL